MATNTEEQAKNVLRELAAIQENHRRACEEVGIDPGTELDFEVV